MIENDLTMAATLSYAYRCLVEGDESMAADAYVEYRRMKRDAEIASYPDRELEDMGK